MDGLLGLIFNNVAQLLNRIGKTTDAIGASTLFGLVKKIPTKNTREIFANYTSPITLSGTLPNGAAAYLANPASQDFTFTYKGKAYILHLTATGSLHEYNPKTNVWTSLAPMPSVRGTVHSVCQVGGKIYVFGGYLASAASNLCHVYDIDAAAWTALANAPFGFQGAVTGATWSETNNKIYVTGVYTNAGTDTNRLISYDIATNTWATETSCPGALIQGDSFGFVADNGKLYRLGGGDYAGSAGSGTFSTSWVYDTVAKTWSSFNNFIDGSVGYIGFGRGVKVNGAYYYVGSRTLFAQSDSAGYVYSNGSCQFLLRFDFGSKAFTKMGGSNAILNGRMAWPSYRVFTDGRNVFMSFYDSIWSSPAGALSRYDTVTGVSEVLMGSTAVRQLLFPLLNKIYVIDSTNSLIDVHTFGIYTPLTYLKAGEKILSNVMLYDDVGNELVQPGVEKTITIDGYAYFYAPRGNTQVAVVIS